MADKELFQEVATVARDWIWPAYGGLMRSADDTLIQRGGGKGLQIYDQIERDARAYSVLQKRKRAPIAREWYVEAADDSPLAVKAADLVERQIKNINIDQVTLDQSDATLKGYAVGEIMWVVVKGEVTATKVLPKEQRRFKFADDYSLRLLTWDHLVEGITVPERKFIVHRFGAKDGNPYGVGLGRQLFWPTFFKRKDVSFWLIYADKFAMPTLLGKYAPGAQPGEKSTLLATLRAVAHDAGVALPDNQTIEMLEASRSGGSDTYERLARYMDEQIAEIVLGETLTTNVGSSGSLAAGQVHNEVRLELAKGDADLISETFNESLVKWIVDLNLPGAPYPKLFRQFQEEEDLNQRAERDTKIYGLGFKPTPEYIRQTYGEGWVPREAGPQLDPEPSPMFGQGEAPANQDASAQFAARASREAGDAVAAMVDPMERAVEEATDLADLKRRMMAAYPKADPRAFAGLMQKALVAAHMAGRHEVARGR